ncbi:hypothetical protein D3C78_1866060 [compost metagenome]
MYRSARGLVLARVPIDTFVGDVHPVAIAIEKLPELVRGAKLLGVRIRSGLGQLRHFVVPVLGRQPVEATMRAGF